MTTANYEEAVNFRSNENVDILIGLEMNLTDPYAPDINELNDTTKFHNIVGISPFANLEFPANTASEKSDEGPVINQSAQIDMPGTSNYQGNQIANYLAKALNDNTSTQGWLNTLIDSIQYDKRGIKLIFVTRIAQSKTNARTPIAAGDFVSVYRFVAVSSHNTSSTGASYRREIQLITDGLSVPYTMAINGTTKVAPTITPSTLSLAVGKFTQMRATAYGHDVTFMLDWASDNNSVLAVDSTGLVKGNKAGTAKVLASHHALADASQTVTVTAATDATITSDMFTVSTDGGVIDVAGTNLDSIAYVVIDGETLTDWVMGATTGKVYIYAKLSKGDHTLTFVTVNQTGIAKTVTVS